MLTIAGQAIVERPDIRGVFEATPGPGVPVTLALAGATFSAMLQLSLVCERWPLAGVGRLRSGVAALALSWAIGIGAYFLFDSLDALPAAERAAAGLRNPGGPIAAPDFGSALIAVGVWQTVLFIALRQFRNRSVAPGRLHTAIRTGPAVAGATARPSGSSTPLSSNSTTPLHSRLHPARDVLPRSWPRCGPAPEQPGTAADAGIPLSGPGSLDGPHGPQLAGQLPDVVGGYESTP